VAVVSTVEPISRPGVTVNKTLAQILNLTDDSPAAIEWQKRMADLDGQERRSAVKDANA